MPRAVTGASILRDRRGLNTTPDSVSPSKITSFVPDLPYSSEDSDPDEISSKTATQRPRAKYVEHVYYTDVEEINLDWRITPESSSFDDNNHFLEQCRKYVCQHAVAVLLTTCLFGVFLSILYCQNSSPSPQTEQSVPSLHQLTDRLSAEFPDQPARLWAQIRGALEPQYRYYHGLEAFSEAPNAPSVILLAQGATSLACDVERPSEQVYTTSTDADRRLLHHFIQRLGELISNVILQGSNARCSELNVEKGFEEPTEKLSLDTRMRTLYSSGHRCIYFPAIDRLSHGTVLFFHGAVDASNSVYNNVIFLLTLETTMNTSISLSSATASDLRRHSAKSLEHKVSTFLRSLWTPSLGVEEVDALLSRITPNTLILHNPVMTTDSALD